MFGVRLDILKPIGDERVAVDHLKIDYVTLL